jgi:hypothetical protein
MQAAEMRYIRTVETCTRLGHIKNGSIRKKIKIVSGGIAPCILNNGV